MSKAGRGRPTVYHWRHGWIPLNHAAAMAKAHGDRHLADRYVPPAKAPKKTPQHVLDYRAARAEQDRRFEAHTGGGISAEQTHSQEYRDYFGAGDHSTAGAVEPRLTYRSHLHQLSQSRAYEKSAGRSYKAGVALAKRHHRARLSTTEENAQYDDAAGRVEHVEHFDQGYGEGLAIAYEKATVARHQVPAFRRRRAR